MFSSQQKDLQVRGAPVIHLLALRREGEVFVFVSSVTDWTRVKSVSILLPTLYQ